MRFKGLDLNLLQALDVLIDARSVTRAAEHLHISQPAISAALGRLRKHFGDPLLVLHGKKMIPTPYALQLQPGLKSLLADIDAFISTSPQFEPARSNRTFRVMASDFILAVVLGDLLPAIEAIAPHVRFLILPTSEQAIPMLEAGELDLLIAPETYLSDKHPAILLFEERHVVVGWNESPLIAQAPSVEALKTASFVTVDIGSSQKSSFVINELDQLGIKINRNFSVSYFSLVPQLLIGSNKLAILHESLARKSARHLPIRWWPLPVEIPAMREMIQVHRARSQDPALRWLIARFETWREEFAASIEETNTPA